MPWNRNDPDPLEARRRQLAEQERLLSEQRRRLTEQLHQSGESPPASVKPAEPPVWRMEEDGRHERVADPTPARKRNLARQRQRDMILFFVFIGLFLIVLVIVLWVAYVHNTAPINGA
jgi:hypothetical protein